MQRGSRSHGRTVLHRIKRLSASRRDQEVLFQVIQILLMTMILERRPTQLQQAIEEAHYSFSWIFVAVVVGAADTAETMPTRFRNVICASCLLLLLEVLEVMLLLLLR